MPFVFVNMGTLVQNSKCCLTPAKSLVQKLMCNAGMHNAIRYKGNSNQVFFCMPIFLPYFGQFLLGINALKLIIFLFSAQSKSEGPFVFKITF